MVSPFKKDYYYKPFIFWHMEAAYWLILQLQLELEWNETATLVNRCPLSALHLHGFR